MDLPGELSAGVLAGAFVDATSTVGDGDGDGREQAKSRHAITTELNSFILDDSDDSRSENHPDKKGRPLRGVPTALA